MALKISINVHFVLTDSLVVQYFLKEGLSLTIVFDNTLTQVVWKNYVSFAGLYILFMRLFPKLKAVHNLWTLLNISLC